MGHSNDWKTLYKGTGISIGEINTTLNAGTLDLGSLCKHTNLNPWAKYKPFRYNAYSFTNATAWENAMKSAGWGFGDTVTAVDTDYIFYWSGASKEWVSSYLKPRGGSYNEYFRQLDFVDLTANSQNGYYHDAVPPLDIEFSDDGTYIDQAGDAVVVNYDFMANSNWVGSKCLSMSDLLVQAINNTASKTYYLAVLFKPTGHSELNSLLVSSVEASDFLTQTPSYFEIPFTGLSSQSSQTDGIYVPAIGDTGEGAGSRDGDTVSMTVCLAENKAPSSGDNYRLVTGAELTTTKLLSMNLYNNIDKNTLPIVANNSIQGSKGTITATVTDLGYVLGTDGMYRKFRIEEIFVTTTLKGPYWGTRNSLTCMFYVDINSCTADLGTDANNYDNADIDDNGPIMGDGVGVLIRNSHQASSQADNREEYETVSAINLNQAYSAVYYSSSTAESKNKYPCIYVWPGTGSGSHTLTIRGIMFTGNPDNPKPNGGITLTAYTKTINI